MKIKPGEIWTVDGRKGGLMIRVLDALDTSKDSFFNAEIVGGSVRWASDGMRYEQSTNGAGKPGSVVSMRTSLTAFLKKMDVALLPIEKSKRIYRKLIEEHQKATVRSRLGTDLRIITTEGKKGD